MSVDALKQAFERVFADSEKIKPGDKVYLKGRLNPHPYLTRDVTGDGNRSAVSTD